MGIVGARISPSGRYDTEITKYNTKEGGLVGKKTSGDCAGKGQKRPFAC
jgi:hypothetical protein